MNINHYHSEVQFPDDSTILVNKLNDSDKVIETIVIKETRLASTAQNHLQMVASAYQMREERRVDELDDGIGDLPFQYTVQSYMESEINQELKATPDRSLADIVTSLFQQLGIMD